MKLFRNIELRNLLVDIILILLMIQYLDVSEYVLKSFPYVIYTIIFVQSITYLLMYGSSELQSFENDESKKTFLDKVREVLYIIPGFSMMFYFAIGWVWILAPVNYLDFKTGTENEWIFTYSGIVGLVMGVVVLVRLFAHTDHKAEKEYVENFDRNSKYTTFAERIIIPVYGFIIYGTVKNEKLRNWLGYILGFAFLIYTETLFEIMIYDEKFMADDRYMPAFTYFALFFSFFPVRLLMLIKPPFSIIEIISAFITFGIFLYMLLG